MQERSIWLRQCHVSVQRLPGMADRVHVPQVAAAIPKGVRLQQRQRCIVCTSNEGSLQQALSTCAHSSMASHDF